MKLSQLHDLFPDADFGFSMKMRPGRAAEFFRKTESAAEVLDERNQWLSSGTSHYAAVGPESGPLVGALASMAAKWDSAHLSVRSPASSPIEPMIHLGRCWEPDFLLLAPNQDGRFILQAGCVCFPSSWALQEKLGQPLEVIHGVVPGLNMDVGKRIQTFLTRMKPGAGWFRSNWGISSSPERNQHPSRGVNQLGSGTRPQSTWVRIEHQVLAPLDDCEGILFGIRLEIVALPEFRRDPVLRAGLSRALATMPDAMAEYKNLQHVRSSLLSFLNEGSKT